MGGVILILADTHAWVYFLDSPHRLSEPAAQALQSASATGTLVLSTISLWEIAYLHRRGRLSLTMALDDWLDLSLSLSFLTVSPVGGAIARAAALLPDIHRDPADRFILATALQENMPVVSADSRFKEYPKVKVIW